MAVERLLLVKGLPLAPGRVFLGAGDFAIMSTVTTSIERPLTEPELAELGKQQARLLQEIGELVTQKKVAVDEFKAAIGETRSKSRISPNASIWAWRARISNAMCCSTRPRKGGRVLLPLPLARSLRSKK